MPYLEIAGPDEPSRRVDVAATAVVGRGEDCEIKVVEKKSSRRHLRLKKEPGGPWIAEDLDSANGTFVGESRILRHRLVDGTKLRLGDTLLTWHEEAAPTLVGGKLALRSVGPGAVPGDVSPAPSAPRAAIPVGVGASAAVPAAVPPGADDADAGAEAPGDDAEVVTARPVRPLDMRSFGRAAALFVVGLLAVGAVQMFLAPKADKADAERRAKRGLQDLLARADADQKAFEREAETWLATWPSSPDRALLERHLEAMRGRTGVRAGVEARFDTILARLGSLPEVQVRAELLALKRELPEDGGLAERVRLAFVELDRRRAAYEKAEGERAREEAGALVAQNLPGAALRRLQSWRNGRGVLSPDEAARLAAAEEETQNAIRKLAEISLATAKREPDADKRRKLLQAAWLGLAGTNQQELIADALRYADAPIQGQPGTSGTGTGPTTDAGEVLLGKAADAERMMAARRWVDARAAFEALLLEKGAPQLLLTEWTTRRADVDRVLGLVKALGEEAVAAKGAARKLAGGPVTVTAADAAGVTLKRGDTEAKQVWTEVEPDEVIPLLTTAKPTPEQRMGLAVLAASLSKPETVLQVLTPLYDPGPGGAEVDALVARLLNGQAKAPDGGYRLYQGELVDRAGYEKRVEAERLTQLESRAVDLLIRLAKEPVFKRLERMRQARADLDKHRLEALLAIFNETHYPYPYKRGTPPYTIVQAEVDRRVEIVRTLWEGEEHMKIPRTGAAGKLADDAAAAIKELESKGRDVVKLKATLARYEPYMTGETITLKEFAINGAERKFMTYNRWVMETYNPAQTAYISDVERAQVQITNEYRMMMGFTCTVAPGDAAYESIDATNVARVLDAGKILPGSVTLLRAVRIDDRLVKSGRGHSQDMQRRGYFDHFSPPNPATGEPRKSPFDRMRDAGYEGQGASENIAMAGGWRDAHVSWCHSSGHHRNILSAWTDMGTGAANQSHWTQNFGIGGGKAAVIEAVTTPPEKKEKGKEKDK